MKSVTMRAICFFLLFTIVCGVIYTGVVTALAQVVFPRQANGSLIEVDGKVYGSELIGQSFTGDTHMWGRPVSVDVSTYKDSEGNPLAYAAPSNLSPATDDYEALVAERVELVKAAHPERGDLAVPVELVTGSGSGLDPQISVAAANYQIERLSAANGLTAEDVRGIIAACTNRRFLGIIGEETVNVLKVNLMLEGKMPPKI